ncbi:MAG: class II fructose-bisphosphate aldolase family protein [Synergistaceae bacterium]|nr:class II fructose-bisphosphate aldolase family protein [Synergistaceae bacterium]
MYVTSEKLLLDAAAGGYAVGAFNAENAEMVWAIITAAEEMRSPVIIQTTPSTLKYLPESYFAGMVRNAGQAASVPVALHLDHGSSFELAKSCVETGYSSVMIDGSKLSYEENAALTKRVCDFAREHGIPVEGEIGVIGGKEETTQANSGIYTDPVQAAAFAYITGVSSLAISIGTAHGFYKTPPVLDLNRISETKNHTNVPLVMHGGSGLSDETLGRAARLGMSKINFATELRDVYTKAMREYIASDPGVFDPKKYGSHARTAVKELVKHKMRVCMSEGRI